MSPTTLERPPLSAAFHDVRNALGAVALNLEIAADPSAPASDAREAASEALAAFADLEARIERLGAAVAGGRP